ncbi:amidase family protein [Ruicaihuangia caeni]|uniref:amidase family protein n=1 Tax=Ruicaihuangia caeni TaxID=3042517 RepID=UPI00338D456C
MNLSISPTEVVHLGGTLGMHVSDAEASELASVLTEQLNALGVLDEVASKTLGGAPTMAVHEPSASEDAFHAWDLQFDLGGATSGPLQGRTAAVKASIEVAGVPVSAGNTLVQHVPTRNSSVVERLLRAGARIVGTTRLSEFEHDGAGITGHPRPLPDNPASPGFVPGGSSSGSAAVVAAGEVDFAIGSDTGGSIREPASWTGVVGLKPTTGLVPLDGTPIFEPSLTALGPMARTVEVCAQVLSAIADGQQDFLQGLDAGVSGIRIGVLEQGFGIAGHSDPVVDATVREAIAVLERCGAHTAPVSVPWHEFGVPIWSGIATEGSTIQLVDNAAGRLRRAAESAGTYMDAYARALHEHAGAFPYTRKAAFLLGRYLLERPEQRRYSLAIELGHQLRRAYDDAFEQFDLLVMPTTPQLPFRAEPAERGIRETLALAAGSYQNAAPFNVSGHPALSVPCGTVDGLPVGLMLVGRRAQDALVLRAGHAYEQARDALRQGGSDARATRGSHA